MSSEEARDLIYDTLIPLLEDKVTELESNIVVLGKLYPYHVREGMDWSAIWKEGVIGIMVDIYYRSQSGDIILPYSVGYIVVMGKQDNRIAKIISFSSSDRFDKHMAMLFVGVKGVEKCSIPQLDITFDVPPICIENHPVRFKRCTDQIKASLRKQLLPATYRKLFSTPLSKLLILSGTSVNRDRFYPIIYCYIG